MTTAFTPGQGVPARLVAGDLWTWRADAYVGEYPAASFALTFVLAPTKGGAAFSGAATADADGLLVEITSTGSAAVGEYTWTLYAVRASDSARRTLGQGTVCVDPDPTKQVDRRTPARKLLDAIEAVLAKRIPKDVEDYSIEGRSLTRTPQEVLMKHRARLQSEVQAEERAARGAHPSIKRRRIYRD